MERLSDLPGYKFFKPTLSSTQNFCECAMKRLVRDQRRIKFWQQNWGYGFVKHEFPLLYKEAIDHNMALHARSNSNSKLHGFI